MKIRETDPHGNFINEYDIENIEAWKLDMISRGAESVVNPDPKIPTLFKIFYGPDYWDYLYATIQEES